MDAFIEPQRLVPGDAGELLTLQRAAFVTEAILHSDLTIPPLYQTFEELVAELGDPDVVALGIRLGTRLVASVRVRVDGAVGHVGRLMVAPDMQGKGLGTKLLTILDDELPASVSRLELFTGSLSVANIRLYERLGYVEEGREPAVNHDMVHMARPRITQP